MRLSGRGFLLGCLDVAHGLRGELADAEALCQEALAAARLVGPDPNHLFDPMLVEAIVSNARGTRRMSLGEMADSARHYAADTSLLSTLEGQTSQGQFLNRATSHYPAVLLGAAAARALGIDRADGSNEVWLGNQWFSVVGILQPLTLAPDLDRSALVGFPVAETLLHADGSPVQIYVRTDPTSVAAVQSVLAATADPAAPQDAAVANPTDALTARADASAAFQSLFLALGAVALIVGGIGIANVMVIAVLERRGEIGLRRALGARRAHIGIQFVAEATLLAVIGGAAGSILGALATAVYASARHWHTVVALPLVLAAVALALLVGATAGLYPALRASRLSRSEALRTV
jgi:putative ABC transport system permease protein